MPFIQKNLPPPPPIQSFALHDFTGGLNNIVSETLIKDNQSSDILNVDFTEDGVLEKRGGLKKISTIGNKPITYIGTYNPTYSDEVQVHITGGDLYINNKPVITNSNILNCTQYNDKLYAVNGKKIFIIGKFPQEENTHIKITGTKTTEEVVFELVNPPTEYTPLAETNSIGVFNYDYDKKQCWYEPCRNELNDEYKGVNLIPSSPTMIIVHKERLFVISDEEDPGSIYLSDIDGGMYYPVSLGLHIPPTGDRIVGMCVFTDSLIIGTHKDIYYIYGDTNRSLSNAQHSIKHINTHTGFKNSKTIMRMHNYLVFLGNDNNIYIMSTTKTDVDLLSTKILNVTVNFLKHPINATSDMLNNSVISFADDKLYLIIPEIKTILFYSYKFMSWSVYRTVLNIDCISSVDNVLYISDSTGNVYKFDKTVYTDDGNLFKTYWHSKRFSFNDETLYKKFKDMFIIAHVYEDVPSDIRITYEVDYVDVVKQELITSQKSIWGKTQWGDRFITRDLVPSLPTTIGQRGRFIKFKIYNGYWLAKTYPNYISLETDTKKNQELYYVTDENKFYINDTGVLKPLEHYDVEQPMKLYNVSGTYQLKGRR